MSRFNSINKNLINSFNKLPNVVFHEWKKSQLIIKIVFCLLNKL